MEAFPSTGLRVLELSACLALWALRLHRYGGRRSCARVEKSSSLRKACKLGPETCFFFFCIDPGPKKIEQEVNWNLPFHSGMEENWAVGLEGPEESDPRA